MDTKANSLPTILSSIFFVICFSASLIGIWLDRFVLINFDAGAILTTAQQMLHGRQLYTDIFTSQFPFIFYFSMIPIGIHLLTGLTIPDAFFACIFVLLQISALLSWRIIRRHPICIKPFYSYVLLAAFYCNAFFAPLFGYGYLSCFGEREHLFIVLVLPYMMLAINRLAGKENHRWEQVVAGLLGFIGFSLKPHFILFFIFSELFEMSAKRNWLSWNRLDAWIIGIMSLAYYVWFIFCYPTYFILIPLFLDSYRYYYVRWVYIAFKVLLTFALPAMVMRSLMRSSHSNIFYYLCTWILCGEIVYAQPHLPYFYHIIPVYYVSLILFVFAALEKKKDFIALLILPLFLFYIHIENRPLDMQHYVARRANVLTEAEALKPYKTLASFHSDINIYPEVNYAGSEWVLNMSFLEYLPAAYADQQHAGEEAHYHTLPEMSEAERIHFERIINDLQQKLPDAIVIDESTKKLGFKNMKFDYLHYFMQDTRFRTIWAHYEFVANVSKNDASFLGRKGFYDAVYRRKD